MTLMTLVTIEYTAEYTAEPTLLCNSVRMTEKKQISQPSPTGLANILPINVCRFGNNS